MDLNKVRGPRLSTKLAERQLETLLVTTNSLYAVMQKKKIGEPRRNVTFTYAATTTLHYTRGGDSTKIQSCQSHYYILRSKASSQVDLATLDPATKSRKQEEKVYCLGGPVSM